MATDLMCDFVFVVMMGAFVSSFALKALLCVLYRVAKISYDVIHAVFWVKLV